MFKKSVGHLWPADLVDTYHYTAQRRAQVCVRLLCQVLRVGPSAYHAWQWDQVPASEPAWQVSVRKEFRWHSVRYGTRRLRAKPHAQGHQVGR